MVKYRKSLCIAGLLVLSPLIYGDEHKEPTTFSIHDTNKDGYLSRAEYDAFVELRERHIDDSRGYRHRSLSVHPFESVDSNQDGLLTETELVDALNKGLRKQRRIRAREGQW